MQSSDSQSKPFIVVSAYSFAPRQGSESGTAWATVLTLLQEYRVIVVCVGHYRPYFKEDDLDELKKLGAEVIFFEDEKHYWILRLPGMFWHKIYYTFWQRATRELFKSLVSKYQPVAIQHVNWGTGRAETSIVGHGIPVIFGPVGGFESGNRQTDQGLGWRLRFEEELRRFHIRKSMRSETLKKMYRQIDLVLACTKESAEKIEILGARRLERITNAGISKAKFDELQILRKNKSRKGSHLKLFFASRLVGWKGEELAIRALAALNDITTELTILGSGKNLSRCTNLAKNLNVSHRIHFISFLPRWDDIWSLYINSDVFLFLSLHDSGGTGALEAMAAGLPVICLDLGGPGEYIDDTCGVKIPPNETLVVVEKIAHAIQELRDNVELRQLKGKKAAEKCGEHFTWEARGAKLLNKIRSVWNP